MDNSSEWIFSKAFGDKPIEEIVEGKIIILLELKFRGVTVALFLHLDRIYFNDHECLF